MPLAPCSTLFGEATVVQQRPLVELDVDRIYRPFSSDVFFDRDRSWGIYEINGRIDPQAAYVRGPDLSLVGQSSVLPLEGEDVDTITEEHVYFGPLIPHYGHFLVTSLARAWYLSSPDTARAKLLCHSDHQVRAHFDGSYMGALAEGLGLDADRFTRPTRVTRFTQLTIPGAAFLEQKCAHAAFVEPMHRIGDALGSGMRKGGGRPIYLSKSRIGPGSVAHVTNEAEIERALAERGIDIVHPEQLTLTQQVELFASTDTILGFVGSAFHTHVFVRNPPKIVGVTLHPFINSNVVMLDRLNAADGAYFYPQGNISEADVPGFGVARTIHDVAEFVDDLLEEARLPSGKLLVGHGLETAIGGERVPDENCIPDHTGESYRLILEQLHNALRPKAYLEIGTLKGETLKLSSSPSIAIDPKFQVTSDVVGTKEQCLFYQLESDVFFAKHDPKVLLGAPLDFCFLDGMHRCEFLLRDFINAEGHSATSGIIALHDCLPVELPMTDRRQNGTPPVMPHRGGWWTGDVWRTVAALRKYRPDLRILCLDAAPTGLVLIANLDPTSRVLRERYEQVVTDMMAMDLEAITITGFLRDVAITPTSTFAAPGTLLRALGR